MKFYDGPAAGMAKEYDREMTTVRYGFWLYEHTHKRDGDHWLFVKRPRVKLRRQMLAYLSATMGGGDPRLDPKQEPNKVIKRGRNQACWCGSGKKFKKCHGTPLSN